MKLLLSAYACEPDRGSEPGVGWEWAHSLSEIHSVTVITRANNQDVIERWYNDNPEQFDPINKPTFFYYDPPSLLLWLKKKGWLPVQLFYTVWQAGVAWKFRKKLKSHDILHHVTFNSMMLPGFWWFADLPIVLGPLGGTSCVREEYLPIYGRKKWKEKIRGAMVNSWVLMPWIRFSFNQASAIYCANTETKRHIDREYPEKTRQMLETGVRVDLSQPAQSRSEPEEPCTRFIWIGALEPWKAVDIALEAFAKILEGMDYPEGIRLDLVGTGAEQHKAEQLVNHLSIQDHVVFHGQVAKSEIDQLLEKSRGLIFSSIKDTSGNVVLEAMLQSRAVICINHQGVADITTDETAVRIEPGTFEDTVNNFANAMQLFVEQPQLAFKMGQAGYERVSNVYSWVNKAKEMDQTYQQIMRRCV